MIGVRTRAPRRLIGARNDVYPETGPPDGFREMLEKLIPRIAMHVPDDILEIWFSPGAASGMMDGPPWQAREHMRPDTAASSLTFRIEVRASFIKTRQRKSEQPAL